MAREKAAQQSLDPATVDRLKQALARGREAYGALARLMPPTRGLELAYAAADLADELVTQLAVESASALERQAGKNARALGEQVAIVPVGGYGRRELCPRSDIDLLFLMPSSLPRGGADHVHAFVNTVLYGLWDLGFEVGHAVRNVDECVRYAREDQAIKTGLLDARLLFGPPALFAELERAIDRELLAGKGSRELIAQKLDEAAKRRERFGNTVYLLEPNVKASEGGLRELHTALWIARAKWGALGMKDLPRVNAISLREEKTIERAYGFLLRTRIELHLVSGRRQDVLGFDHQERIAETLGYLRPEAAQDHDRRKHGVERFMRAYYFHARQIARISQQIIERATLRTPDDSSSVPQRAPGGFKLSNGMLTLTERDQLERDPPALVRIFRVAQEEALSIYSYTKDLIVEALPGLDRRVRRSPEVVGDFLALLEEPKSDGSILEQMHDLGVLRRLMPEVARMSAKWQHSLYHVYTVDVHSLFVVRFLKQLRMGEQSSEQPELTRMLAELPRPNVVYLAGFLHDIGKGWNKGDHSIRGAVTASVIGRRFEEANLSAWTAEDTADLEWLVREHLTMSDISQRRDVSDHDLIETFAASCRTHERLAMLYLLTYADMRGTSPKVWTDWKATLLREVYEVTRAVLSQSIDRQPAGAHASARRKRVEAELLAEKAGAPEVIAAFVAVLPERYMLSIPARQMVRHVEMWREVKERGGIAMHVKQLCREGSTRLTVVCPDRPGLLALLAGTVAANRMFILSAQIFSIEELAVDVLYLKDEAGGLCDDPARWEQVRADLSAVLAGEASVAKLLDRVRGSTLSARPKPAVKTEIVVANDVSKTETVVDVFCQDRMGALYTIAQALADAGLTISVAKISTQGDRVADGFYVADAATGAKIADKERIDAIKRGVKDAIEKR